MRGDDPVGTIGMRTFGHGVAELKRLFVRPSERGQGLGARLFKAIVREAEAGGYRTARLKTLATMHGPKALYRELGFKQIQAYYQNEEDCLEFFEKTLSVDAHYQEHFGSARTILYS